LFQSEYHMPLLSPELAAHLAAFAEHFFPMLILIGFATRFSALALLGMTLTIQLFVYPDAYPTHGTWAAVLLYLMATGPGKLSIDHLIAKRYAR
jgi:Predicted membrane protein